MTKISTPSGEVLDVAPAIASGLVNGSDKGWEYVGEPPAHDRPRPAAIASETIAAEKSANPAEAEPKPRAGRATKSK